MLISKKLNAAINEQVGHEFAAMLQYVAIATYFDGGASPVIGLIPESSNDPLPSAAPSAR